MRYREIITTETASEAGIVKPIKPLTPAQQQRKQEKNTATQKRIHDTENTLKRRISDLRSKLV